MLQKIQKQLPQAAAEDMLKQLNLLQQQMNDYQVSLNDEQRLGLRTMAEGREGYVKLVSDIAATHTESLPRNEDPAELKQALAYYSMLSSLRLSVAKLYEMLDDTQTATGADIMAFTDRYTAYLQTARKANTALDTAMNEVDTWNIRYGVRTTKEAGAAS